jgi:transposase-like protein
MSYWFRNPTFCTRAGAILSRAPNFGCSTPPYAKVLLSFHELKLLLAERGLEISYETVRRWVLKFGPLIAGKLRQGRPRPSERWHLDEMVVRIARKRMYLWRASTTRAKSSTCSFRVGEIPRRHSG